MIRRRVESSFLLITQVDVCRCAGELCALIGGAFTTPAQITEMQQALSRFAEGFADYDASPMLDAAGRPMVATDLPLAALLTAWTKASELAATDHPTTRLLVSLLSLQLSSKLPTRNRGMRELFEINKHQHREIERQASLRPHSNLRNDLPMRFGLPDLSVSGTTLSSAEQTFIYSYHQLVFCLNLATQLAMHHRLYGEIPPTPPSPGDTPVQLALKWTEGGGIALAPWPFSPAQVTLSYSGKLIPSKPYDHERELFSAYAQGRAYTLTSILAPGT